MLLRPGIADTRIFLKLGRLENELKDGGASRIAFDAGSAAVIDVILESSEEVD